MKGLESWKEKNLEDLIEREVRKRNPEQSEEQKRISALEQELEKRDARRQNVRSCRSNALGKAQELNLPTSLVDRFLGDSDEDTEQNLKALKETFDKYVQKGVESKFKSSGRDVKESRNQDLDPSNVKSIEEMAKEINIRK
ncbi:capsid assembly scaffolding protein Gp46 family protein [Staphylococcus aureus]